MKHAAMTRRAAAIGLPLALLAPLGCATYGSRTHTADVRTWPSGLRVYAVPHNAWIAKGGRTMLDDPKTLAPYKLRGFSPMEDVVLRAHRYVFVAERDGEFEIVEQMIDRDDAPVDIELEPRSDAR